MSPNALSLWLALGGILGGALHAWVTKGDAFLTRTTAGTCFIGGIVGVLYPLYPVIPFPDAANTVQKAAMMALIAYVAGDGIQNLLPGLFAKVTGQKPS